MSQLVFKLPCYYDSDKKIAASFLKFIDKRPEFVKFLQIWQVTTQKPNGLKMQCINCLIIIRLMSQTASLLMIKSKNLSLIRLKPHLLVDMSLMTLRNVRSISISTELQSSH